MSLRNNFCSFQAYKNYRNLIISPIKVLTASNHSFNTIYDVEKFKDASYIEKLRKELTNRKGNGDLDLLHKLFKLYPTAEEAEKTTIAQKITEELRKLPNSTCPNAVGLSQPKVLSTFGKRKELDKALLAEKVALHGIETERYGSFAEDKSYCLRGSMARLQHKLVRYAVRELLRNGFTLMSVPDLVTKSTLRDCGAPVDGERTMVYHLDHNSPGCGEDDPVCLSGTAEMSLGGWLKNRTFERSELPLKLCAVSRCYRVEATRTSENKGLYRVHSFFKVEMFAVTDSESGEESDRMYQELVETQKKLLANLGLHGKVLLMPPDELGNPATSKTDLEVWMPGRSVYGELTSASNCTSYQAMRLGVRCRGRGGEERFVHTLNGTAIALPRCIIALCETHQEPTGRKELRLPSVLGVGGKVIPSTGVEEGDLEKIMTYHEKCGRAYIINENFRDNIRETSL